ncbi:sodium-coupled monocarboxylate transporter 1-like, partial [Glandiceps talaboti]
ILGSSINVLLVHRFTIADYVILGCVLTISSGIGVYYAIVSRKRRSSKEFLLAGRNMGALPVATSLIVSFVSSITVIGTPAEIYLNGTMYSWYALNYVTSTVIAAHLYMPVFYNLDITSVYEYLEIRFNSKACRIVSCCTFIVQTMIYMGIGIYTPSLALNAVTGFSLWGSVLTVGFVCTFYTSVGGMKAVLWTDAFQLLIMVTGFLALLIQASINHGGWGNIMDICKAGGRIEFDSISLDPTVRHTVWSLGVGGFFSWGTVYLINQSQVQRYLSCRTMRTAQIAIYANVPGLTLLLALAICGGLAMYATYVDCDPFTAKYVSAPDQLMPYFVMDILYHIRGLPGLFISCMFCAALSTVSSGLNSLAAVTGEDIVRQIWKDLPDKTYTRITVGLAVFYGLFSVFMAWVSSLLGSVLQATISVFGMLGGPLLGIFTLGLFVPWANSKGALTGFFSGLGVALWFGIGGFLYRPPPGDKLSLSTAECPVINTTDITPLSTTTHYTMMTTTSATMPQDSYPSTAVLYTLSYLYYGAIAWVIVILVGLIVSIITGRTKPEDVNPKTLSPLIRLCYYRDTYASSKNDDITTALYGESKCIDVIERSEGTQTIELA